MNETTEKRYATATQKETARKLYKFAKDHCNSKVTAKTVADALRVERWRVYNVHHQTTPEILAAAVIAEYHKQIEAFLKNKTGEVLAAADELRGLKQVEQ